MRFFGHFADNKPTSFGSWLTRQTVKAQFKFLNDDLPSDRSIAILEIGPGRGEFASEFLQAGYVNYSIVEPDDTLRAICESLPVKTAYSTTIPPFPVASGTQDLVIMCDVFEHMNDTKMATDVIAEMKRVLKPNGLVLILSPDYLQWKEEFYNCDFSHSNPTTVRRTSQMFSNAGIETVKYGYHYNFLSGVIGMTVGGLVKLLTGPLKGLGASNDSRLYRLRLCFLRRFLIIGRNQNL